MSRHRSVPRSRSGCHGHIVISIIRTIYRGSIVILWVSGCQTNFNIPRQKSQQVFATPYGGSEIESHVSEALHTKMTLMQSAYVTAASGLVLSDDTDGPIRVLQVGQVACDGRWWIHECKQLRWKQCAQGSLVASFIVSRQMAHWSPYVCKSAGLACKYLER
jgi:hypothetical protein